MNKQETFLSLAENRIPKKPDGSDSIGLKLWKLSNHDDTYAAMDLWAKKISIAFDEWKNRQKYEKRTNGFYCNEPPVAGKQTFFTMDELYEIFINQYEP